MATDAQRVREAAAKYGHLVDSIASRYVNPLTGRRLSGTALLLKVAQGESQALTNPNARTATSSAGAKGWTQFTAGSRATAIKDFGIDPWRSPDEAIHAAALHLRGKINGSTGLEGYNPGDPSYTSYILGQKVGPTGAVTGGAPSPAGGTQANGANNGALNAGAPTSGLSSLLATLSQPPAPPVSVPAAPSFSAAPALPKGALAVPDAGGPPQPTQDTLAAKLAAIDAMAGQGVDLGDGSSASSSSSGGAAPASGEVLKGFKRGDPVVDGTGVGGTHETSGLPGFPAHDFFAPSGSPAVAPVSGKVVKLSGHDPKDGPTQGPHGPLGWSVYIRGRDGKTYFLTHLGSRNVKIGESVSAGMQIGTVADYAKYGTPSHIHMGVSGG